MARLNIEAHLHRFVAGSTRFREVVQVRHYARVETAMRCAMEYLMFSGEVGDIMVFVLKKNGLEVGTMRLKANCKLDIVWNDKEANKLRNRTMMAKSDRNSLVNYKEPPKLPVSNHIH